MIRNHYVFVIIGGYCMLIRAVKLSLGALVGILGAYFLGLSNPLTAGIIVLLSLGKTKRSSIDIALVRIKSVSLALLLASATFLIASFTVYSFGLFLFLYIPFVLKFKLEDGLIIGSVLSTHLIAVATVDFDILFNTIMLFIIGVSVALVFNMYMPDMSKEITQDQRYIEDRFRELLFIIATIIRGDKNFDYEMIIEIESFIDHALTRAQANEDNYLMTDVSYHTSYIKMRKLQFDVLSRMFGLVWKVDMNLVQADLIADLTEELAHTLSKTNSGKDLLIKIDDILVGFQEGELPKSRKEFENRAVLFQYLSEFRHMVELKREFSNEYDGK
jgi:uncharacterized membrane protein YgaE (UPF0421/DUF939 family)